MAGEPATKDGSLELPASPEGGHENQFRILA
jgi:hypothetical protein